MRTDYYAILGVKPSAAEQEIKSAYRKLAILFHPDKNPNDRAAEEKFIKVKEAYEILIDPVKRKKYDSGIHYHQSYFKNSSHPRRPTKGNQKTYTYTEQEFRQRQAFARSYRDFKKNKETVQSETIPPYSDFKYIMISIPLAIGILFLVINILSRDDNHLYLPPKPANHQTENMRSGSGEIINSGLSAAIMGVSLPWDSVFGKPQFDSLHHRSLYIENPSGEDVIVCVKNARTERVIRNNYIFSKNYFYIDFLPAGEYQLMAVYGKDWDKSKLTTGTIKLGFFTEVSAYAVLNDGSVLNFLNTDDTLKVILPYCKTISQKYIINNQKFFSR